MLTDSKELVDAFFLKTPQDENKSVQVIRTIMRLRLNVIFI